MDKAVFNEFCSQLPRATHLVQWGEADVWKIGGKVFAIGGWSNGDAFGVTFKTTEIAFEILRDQPGCRPAPYLASRGLKWIQSLDNEGLSDEELARYIRDSFNLVIRTLTRKTRRDLGFSDGPVEIF